MPGGPLRGSVLLEELAIGFSSAEMNASGDSGTMEPSTSDSEPVGAAFFPRRGLIGVFRGEGLLGRPVRAVANSGSDSEVCCCVSMSTVSGDEARFRFATLLLLLADRRDTGRAGLVEDAPFAIRAVRLWAELFLVTRGPAEALSSTSSRLVRPRCRLGARDSAGSSIAELRRFLLGLVRTTSSSSTSMMDRTSSSEVASFRAGAFALSLAGVAG